MVIETNDPVELAKEIFWLAWQACGGPRGMGFLQNRPEATRDDIWNNVSCSGDYPINRSEPQRPYADYVFGRMMKFGMEITDHSITVRDGQPRGDYQSWCAIYPTYEGLVAEAQKSLAAKKE